MLSAVSEAAAPPSGESATLQQIVPDPAGQTAAPPGGGTATLQHFFPISYKKKHRSKKPTVPVQQEEFPFVPERHDIQDTPTEAQQQDDTVHITASEGVPAWTFSAAGAAGSHSSEQSILMPKKIVELFSQYLNTALESHPELLAHLPQIFQSMLGSRVLSSTTDTPVSFENIQPSFSQNLQVAGRQQEKQLPLISMSTAAAKQQPRQPASFYEQMPEEAQMPSTSSSAKVDWQDIRMELAKEKNLLQGTGRVTMPVTYDVQGQNVRWERLDRNAVKDLAKAIRDNGLASPYFKQLLKGIFGMYDLTPYDLRYLMSSILTDTQSLVWLTRWKRALEELRAKYQGGPNANLTLAQLAGDPPEDNPEQQAARLPRNVLSDIKEAARKAILQIAPAGVQDTIYTDIRQGPSEPFSSFTDRLSQAVDQQVTDEGAKPHLIKSLAFANANQECKRIISTMPHQATLADMVEACSKVGTPQHVASIVEERLGDQKGKHIREAFANF